MTSPYQPEIAAHTEGISHAGEMLLAYPRGRHREFQARPARVTVCVPVFDAGPALGRCLDSILCQQGADFQVLVVDNASTDATFGDACRYASGHDNVLAVQSARNIGRVPNWNRCLEMARGEFLKFVMVHDTLLPGALECLARTMERYPTVALARTKLHQVRADGQVRFIPEWPMSLLLPSATAVEVGMTQFNLSAGPSVQMLRRAPVCAQGLRFDADFRWAADYHFAQRLLRHGDFAYVHESGAVMDLRADRFHNTGTGPQILREDYEVVLRSFQEAGARPQQAEAVVERLQREYAKHRAEARDGNDLAHLEDSLVLALRHVERLLLPQGDRAA